MKKSLILMTIAAAASLMAAPRVDQSNVTITQNGNTRLVTISYTLTEEPGIITVDIQTNNTETAQWESIGPDKIKTLSGEVNKLVTNVGTVQRIYWHPEIDWPDQRIEYGGVRAVVTAWSRTAPPDFAVMDLETPYGVSYYQYESQIPGGVSNAVYKTNKLIMRKMHAAGVKWRMGSPTSGRATEVPHYVQLTSDYYIAIYEVTQKQFHLMCDPELNFAYTGTDADVHPADLLPYQRLRGSIATYNIASAGYSVDSDSDIAKIRQRYSAMGVFDLPTDAQWEFAAHAGNYSLSMGYDFNSEIDFAWMSSNSDGHSHEVGTARPNAYGLYDIIGNIGEWCLDIYSEGDDYAKADGSIAVDPIGATYAPPSRDAPCLRGGYFASGSDICRVAFRDCYNTTATNRSYYGLRLVCNFTAEAPQE